MTLEGIEVIEGYQNYTVTRGCLFGMAEPFTHTGVKANYAFTKQLDLTVGWPLRIAAIETKPSVARHL